MTVGINLQFLVGLVLPLPNTVLATVYSLPNTVLATEYCTRYSILATVYCTRYSILATVYCTRYSILYSLQYTVLATVYSLPNTVLATVYCTRYSILYSLQYTRYRILYSLPVSLLAADISHTSDATERSTFMAVWSSANEREVCSVPIAVGSSDRIPSVLALSWSGLGGSGVVVITRQFYWLSIILTFRAVLKLQIDRNAKTSYLFGCSP